MWERFENLQNVHVTAVAVQTSLSLLYGNHQHFLQTADTILQKLSNYDKAASKIISGDLNFGNCFCSNYKS